MIVAPRDQPTPRCPKCGTVMGLCTIFPRLGVLPEMLSFRCAPCEEIVTLVEGESHNAHEHVSAGLDESALRPSAARRSDSTSRLHRSR